MVWSTNNRINAMLQETLLRSKRTVHGQSKDRGTATARPDVLRAFIRGLHPLLEGKDFAASSRYESNTNRWNLPWKPPRVIVGVKYIRSVVSVLAIRVNLRLSSSRKTFVFMTILNRPWRVVCLPHPKPDPRPPRSGCSPIPSEIQRHTVIITWSCDQSVFQQ